MSEAHTIIIVSWHWILYTVELVIYTGLLLFCPIGQYCNIVVISAFVNYSLVADTKFQRYPEASNSKQVVLVHIHTYCLSLVPTMQCIHLVIIIIIITLYYYIFEVLVGNPLPAGTLSLEQYMSRLCTDNPGTRITLAVEGLEAFMRCVHASG